MRRAKKKKKTHNKTKQFLSESRWSGHVPCFLLDDEATDPGKVSSSTIPREYYLSSIGEVGQRGMMGG